MTALFIAREYNLDSIKFENWVREKGIAKQSFLGDLNIDKSINVEELVEQFKIEQAIQEHNSAMERGEAEDQTLITEEIKENPKYAQYIAAEQEKQKACSQMLITSGFNFDGYRVKKYSGYISGDDVMQIPREWKLFAGAVSDAADVGEQLSKALVKMRRQALKELKEAAYDLGCNAVIGVDYDYITLEPETSNIQGRTVYLPFVFCVTANGNAVVIEKCDDK